METPWRFYRSSMEFPGNLHGTAWSFHATSIELLEDSLWTLHETSQSSMQVPSKLHVTPWSFHATSMELHGVFIEPLNSIELPGNFTEFHGWNLHGPSWSFHGTSTDLHGDSMKPPSNRMEFPCNLYGTL